MFQIPAVPGSLNVIVDANEKGEIIMQNIIRSIIMLALLGVASPSVKAQLFRDGAPPEITYSLPDGSMYISYDHAKTWQLVKLGTDSMPAGIRQMPVKYPCDRTYTRYGVDYVSHNGGTTFWKVAAKNATAYESQYTPDATMPQVVSIIPNPTTGLTMLTLKVPIAITVAISLCDESGKALKSAFNGPMRSGNVAIPLDARSLPSGVYLVIIKTESGSSTSKFVIER